MSRAKFETFLCPVCQTTFYPKRIDAIYCSAKCRMKAHRNKSNKSKSPEQVEYKTIVSLLNNLYATNKQTMIRTIALQAIEMLDDDYRAKFYDAIDTDFYRIRNG